MENERSVMKSAGPLEEDEELIYSLSNVLYDADTARRTSAEKAEVILRAIDTHLFGATPTEETGR